MILIILLVFLIALLHKLLFRNSNYWKEKNVPHEKPLPLIGNIAYVFSGKESIGMAVKRLYDKFDDNVPYFGFYILQTPYLVLKSPELINQVLITDFHAFPNRPFYLNEKLDPILSNFLTMMKNDAWRELRRKLTPHFTCSKLKKMFPLLKEVTDDLENHLQGLEGKDVEVTSLFKRYTVDTISSCAFGINSNSIKNENSEINAMVVKLFDMKKWKRIISVFSYLYCPIIVRIFRLTFFDMDAAKYLTNVFKTVSSERDKLKLNRNDLIDYLNTIQQEESENDCFKLDDVKKTAQAITFYNAGSEPASLLMAYLLYELAMNPCIQDRLRAEIMENLDEKDSLSYETLNEMKYLDMVMQEVLRKYPLSQLLFRCAEQDYTFKETGLTVKKGTPILIPTRALHLDPKHYPDPENFDPERFRGNQRDKSIFLPFGIGPRKCIANRFAMTQMKIAIAMFFEKFEVEPSERTEFKTHMRSFFMTPKSGLYLNIKRVRT